MINKYPDNKQCHFEKDIHFELTGRDKSGETCAWIVIFHDSTFEIMGNIKKAVTLERVNEPGDD